MRIGTVYKFGEPFFHLFVLDTMIFNLFSTYCRGTESKIDYHFWILPKSRLFYFYAYSLLRFAHGESREFSSLFIYYFIVLSVDFNGGLTSVGCSTISFVYYSVLMFLVRIIELRIRSIFLRWLS